MDKVRLAAVIAAVLVVALGARGAQAGTTVILDWWTQPEALLAGQTTGDEPKPSEPNELTWLLFISTSQRVDFKLDQWSSANCLFVYSPDVSCIGCENCSPQVGNCVECVKCLGKPGTCRGPGECKPPFDATPRCDARGAGLLVRLQNPASVNRFGISAYTVEEGTSAVSVVRIPPSAVSTEPKPSSIPSRGLGEQTSFWRIPLHYIDPPAVVKYVASFAEYTPELWGSTMVFPDGTMVEVPKQDEKDVATLPKLTVADLLDPDALCKWYLTHYEQLARIECGEAIKQNPDLFKQYTGISLPELQKALGECKPYENTKGLPRITQHDVLDPSSAWSWLTHQLPDGGTAADTLGDFKGYFGKHTQWFRWQFYGHYGFDYDELVKLAIECGMPPFPDKKTLVGKDGTLLPQEEIGKLLGKIIGHYLDVQDPLGLKTEEVLRCLKDRVAEEYGKNPDLLARVEKAFKAFEAASMVTTKSQPSPKAGPGKPPVSETEKTAPAEQHKVAEEPSKVNTKVASPPTAPPAVGEMTKPAGEKEEPWTPLNVTPKNVIILQGTQAGAKKLKEMLAAVDYPPRRIKLRVSICEIQEKGLLDLGLQVKGNQAITGAVTDTFSERAGDKGNFEAFSLGDFFRSGVSFEAALGTLESKGEAKVLANPTLTTIEDYPAIFNAVQQVPYTLGSTEDPTNHVISQELSYQPIGIQLSFRPRLGAGDTLTIEVRPVISSLLEPSTTGNTGGGAAGELSAPTFFERRLETIVSVRNGEPFVLAGMIDEKTQFDVDKVPVLSEIPLLGELFRRRNKHVDRSEVCIIVIPEIMEDLAEPGACTTEDGNGNS